MRCRTGTVPDSARDKVRRVPTTPAGGGALHLYFSYILGVRALGTSTDKLFFVYILANCARGVLYVGVTNDLARRIAEHKQKLAPGFTKTYGLFLLVYYEEYGSIVEARARKRALKRWRREWKFALVEKVNPQWRDLAGDLAL